MRKIVLLSILIAASLPFVVYADQFDEQTSSEIIKQAETNYKKVLKVKNAWRDTNKISKMPKKHIITRIMRNQSHSLGRH